MQGSSNGPKPAPPGGSDGMIPCRPPHRQGVRAGRCCRGSISACVLRPDGLRVVPNGPSGASGSVRGLWAGPSQPRSRTDEDLDPRRGASARALRASFGWWLTPPVIGVRASPIGAASAMTGRIVGPGAALTMRIGSVPPPPATDSAINVAQFDGSAGERRGWCFPPIDPGN